MTTGSGWDGQVTSEELRGWERLAGRLLCGLVGLSLLPLVAVLAVVTALAELVLWCRRQAGWVLAGPILVPPQVAPLWDLRGDDHRRRFRPPGLL